MKKRQEKKIMYDKVRVYNVHSASGVVQIPYVVGSLFFLEALVMKGYVSYLHVSDDRLC